MKFGSVLTSNRLRKEGILDLATDVEYSDEYSPEKAFCATCSSQTAEVGTLAEKDTHESIDLDRRSIASYIADAMRFSDTPLTTVKGHLVDPTIRVFDSPFDALDEKLADEVQVMMLIDFIRKGSKIKFAHELANRLYYLHDIVNEDPDEIPISIESLRNFISFLQDTSNLKNPSVVITPSGEIRAQWRTAPNRHFAAAFLPSGDARFVIFKPNPKDPDKIDRFSGITSTDALMETVQPHGILEWAAQ
jgi:hypothetical protein